MAYFVESPSLPILRQPEFRDIKMRAKCLSQNYKVIHGEFPEALAASGQGITGLVVLLKRDKSRVLKKGLANHSHQLC